VNLKGGYGQKLRSLTDVSAHGAVIRTVAFVSKNFVGWHRPLSIDFEIKGANVSKWMIAGAVAISFASALVIDTASPSYARLLSDGKAMEQREANDLMALDRVLALGARPGNAIVSRVSSRNYVRLGRRSDADAYSILDDMAVNNNGPDNYFAPKYRDGKCVQDEGNTLLVEPTFGGRVHKMEGEALEQALSVLCREAAL
jgi:hypothetical protein